MNLEAIARAYTTCAELEERARLESPSLAEDLAVLRSDLHSLLMAALRDSGIFFGDRSQAGRGRKATTENELNSPLGTVPNSA